MDAPIPGTRLTLSGEESPPESASGDGAEGTVAAAGIDQ
jgi:hypothetical protein